MVGIKIKKLNEKVNLLRKTFPKCKIEVVNTSNLYPPFWKIPDDVNHEIMIRDFFSVTNVCNATVTIYSVFSFGYIIQFEIWKGDLASETVDALFKNMPPSKLNLRKNPSAISQELDQLYDILFTPPHNFDVVFDREILQIDMGCEPHRFSLHIKENFYPFQLFDEVVNFLVDFQEMWKHSPAIINGKMRIICAVFENEALKEALQNCAEKLGCDVFYGEPSSPDIIAESHFVAIVDRTLLGAEHWENYLKYCSDTPCIIIDNSDAFAWPKNKRVKDKEWFHFDMNNKRSIPMIMATIKKIRTELKKEALKNLNQGKS